VQKIRAPQPVMNERNNWYAVLNVVIATESDGVNAWEPKGFTQKI